MGTAEKDQRLKAVLYEVVDGLTAEQARAEIPGAPGLALRLIAEVQKPGEKWQGLARTDGGFKRVSLQVEDKQGKVVTEIWRPSYASGGEKQEEEMALLRHVMVDQIVEGGASQVAIGTILSIREARLHTEVSNLREAVRRLPQAEQELAEAEAAFGWVMAAQEEQITL